VGIQMSVSAMVNPLSVTCPICDAQPGELCQEVVRGCIGSAARSHVYRFQIAAEVSQ
jgi:hypothetical protein